MIKYAIIVYKNDEAEFYPDPIYTDLEKARKKVNYLLEYGQKNKMKFKDYGVETLTPEREVQHNKEWQKFCSLMD